MTPKDTISALSYTRDRHMGEVDDWRYFFGARINTTN